MRDLLEVWLACHEQRRGESTQECKHIHGQESQAKVQVAVLISFHAEILDSDPEYVGAEQTFNTDDRDAEDVAELRVRYELSSHIFLRQEHADAEEE